MPFFRISSRSPVPVLPAQKESKVEKNQRAFSITNLLQTEEILKTINNDAATRPVLYDNSQQTTYVIKDSLPIFKCFNFRNSFQMSISYYEIKKEKINLNEIQNMSMRSQRTLMLRIEKTFRRHPFYDSAKGSELNQTIFSLLESIKVASSSTNQGSVLEQKKQIPSALSERLNKIFSDNKEKEKEKETSETNNALLIQHTENSDTHLNSQQKTSLRVEVNPLEKLKFSQYIKKIEWQASSELVMSELKQVTLDFSKDDRLKIETAYEEHNNVMAQLLCITPMFHSEREGEINKLKEDEKITRIQLIDMLKKLPKNKSLQSNFEFFMSKSYELHEINEKIIIHTKTGEY